MDRVLNFVALRPPPAKVAPAPTLASESDFQHRLSEAADSAHPLENAIEAAQAFIQSGRFLDNPDEVEQGERLLALYNQLTNPELREERGIGDQLREFLQENSLANWEADAARARDSVLAGYLVEDEEFKAATALKLLRMYGLVESLWLQGETSEERLASLLVAPLVLPDFLLNLRKDAAEVTSPPSPAETADKLLEQFQVEMQHHARLGATLATINNHDEDELLISELGVQRPLDSLYRTAITGETRDILRLERLERQLDEPHMGNVEGLVKPINPDELIETSPLRRAAARTNVIFSDKALRLLPDPARETLQNLGLDPSTSTVQEMHIRVLTEYEQATMSMRNLSGKLGQLATHLTPDKNHLVAEILNRWRVDPVDEPDASEPVASAPPLTFNTVRPLGVADLYLVRTHLLQYERGEVASLENILSHEKLTHTFRQLDQTESTESSRSEQTSLQSLTQTTAEQNSGKTIAQAIGAGRGPLTSDGPESFSKTVTDMVSTSSSKTNRKSAILRHLRSNEETQEHIFENTAGEDVRFGVYQWLDKIYQAQVFNYGSRLLYDIIVPEPAALFLEALARPRSIGKLPARPARFTVTPDRLHADNWSYYAAGHQATGVEPPPAAEVIVSEVFGGKASDPFSSLLNANNYEVGEGRTARIPKGYKASRYRLIAIASGWTSFVIRAFVGTKVVDIGSVWWGQVFSGKLNGEVESLPVGLIVDGNGTQPGISTLALGIEIICEPTDDAIAAWQTKTHGQILAANQRRLANYQEMLSTREATTRLVLQGLSTEQKITMMQSELKRTALSVLTNQNFSTFNANRIDSLGFPYPDVAATNALSAYIRFFEQAVEWQHLECAFFPYFWGSRNSWVSKILNSETNPLFSAFLRSGAARVVLPIRRGYESAFERFLNTGKTPNTDELLDVGGLLWVSLVTQLREQAGPENNEAVVGPPWEFRVASDLVRTRRDGLLPRWTLNAGQWVEEADADS